MDWIIILVGLGLAVIIGQVWRARKQRRVQHLGAMPAPDASQSATSHEDNPLPGLAQQLREFYEGTAHPEQLYEHPAFREGVKWLSDPSRPLSLVIDSFRNSNPGIQVMAAEALAVRADSAAATDPVMRHLRFVNAWTAFFALRFLGAKADRRVILLALGQELEWWQQNPVMLQALAECISARLKAGENPDPQLATESDSTINPAAMRPLLSAIGTPDRSPITTP